MATPTGAAADATSQNTDTNVEPRQNRASNAPRERPLTDREKMIEGLADRHVVTRQEDERRVQAERAAEEIGTPATEAPSEEQTQPATAASTATSAGANSGLGDLNDYIVVQNGKPMMKLKVDGKEQLVPLDTARVQLQKHTAADQRLARAADAQRQQEAREIALRERDTQLREREAKVVAAESKRGSQPATAAPAAPAVDDHALDTEAREIVDSLLVQPADVAAKTLAKTLRSLRQAPATAQPAVDTDEVAKKAAAAAAHQIRYETAMASGFHEFRKQYGDIASDETLMQLADNRTTGIAKEHPDWTPSQVMLEAGKLTREWMKSHGMATPAAETPTPPPTPAVNRETAKRNLRPMPVARTATPAAAPTEPERDDPRSALAEIRKSRGQPV